ncbi:MAG: di-heme enzyme [Gammaproteobacteria bacterium]|nr:di-heme enzyme [Gammaproteobacteria bacterium]
MSFIHLRNFILLLMTAWFTAGCEPRDDTPYPLALPQNFPLPIIPEDNPLTAAKVELGRHLFYDPALSANQTQSCSSCHQQSYAFAEVNTTSIGSTGEKHRRNAPALVNIAYNKTLTWAHPGLTSLEQQILIPMFAEAPIELGITGHEQTVLKRFTNTTYQKLFTAAYGDTEVTFERINFSLASFVRALISLDSPFDRYAYQNDDDAISASAKRGMNLFFSETFECHHCHGGFNFTQSTFHEQQRLDRRPFHNTGLYNVANLGQYPEQDFGVAEFTQQAQDNGRFRAPTLRNIELTAPYMHDGSVATLEEVLNIYAAGGRNIEQGSFSGDGRQHPAKSPFVKGFEMTEQQRNDLIAFLQTLTDEKFIKNPAFANPWKSSRVKISER